MRDGGAGRPGFTVAELLIALTLSSVVLVGVLGVMTTETKRLSVEREINDTWYTLRSAAALIAWDVRQAAAGDGALESILATSFVIRSPTAAGVVCNKTGNTAQPQYTLRDVSGQFAVNDSVQLLLAAESPSWEYARVQAIGPPGTVGPVNCGTPGTAPTQGIWVVVPTYVDALGATVPKFDTASVKIGVPMMAYRRVRYGITTYQGRSWLGRQLGANIGTANWEYITGPLRADGLSFSYYTAGGATTTDPLAVSALRMTLRGESYGRTLTHERMQDSVTLRVGLRNCDPTVC